MEGKSRNILVILIILVIAVAVFSSFGMDHAGLAAHHPPASGGEPARRRNTGR